MAMNIEVLLSPAEYQARKARGFSGSVCVVFDVLRATSVMVTGLAHGARCFIPVEEISEALVWRERNAELLLAGERNGRRILAAGSGKVDFDLANSPREYIATQVAGKEIVTTTTNGTRALRACATAEVVAVGSFLNLAATASWLRKSPHKELNLVCAGTGEETAIEDVLGAGALIELLLQDGAELKLSDGASLAFLSYRQSKADLVAVIGQGRNGARLLAQSDLTADVAYCLQREVFDLVAVMGRDGKVVRAT